MQSSRRSFFQQLAQPFSNELATQLAQPAKRISVDQTQHLLNRATFGITPDALAHARAIGREAWLDEQLNPASIDNGRLEREMLVLAAWEMDRRELYEAFDSRQYEITMRLREGIFTQAIFSETQLLERVVDFWRDHFNISDETDYPAELLLFEKNVLRQHGFGKFRDLLIATARHPSMLMYLDNFVSRKEAPNENYARELLELHTLGIDGGYTEEDIREVARAFTGWTTHPGTKDGFYFDPEMHDTGRKSVLGRGFPADRGIEDGLQVLSLLARHPATARFVSNKLVRRFVADRPPESLVNSTVQVWQNTDGDIKAVLRHIFLSDEFQRSAGQKYMRPFEYVIAIFRSTEVTYTNWYAVEEILAQLGQMPHGWHPPNGYPDVAGAWINTGGLLNRWNAAMQLTHAAHEDMDDGWGLVSRLSRHIGADGQLPQTAGELVDTVSTRLWGAPVSGPAREEFADYVSDGAGADAPLSANLLSRKMASTFGLMFASPYFQWR